MRFNNRACALMDIPDLPQNAFEHIGNGKIKPQGGGGFVGDFIDNTLGSAGDFLENTGGSVVDFVENTGGSVDEFIREEIPGGYLLPAAIAATLVTGGAASPLLFGEGAALGAAEAAAALEAAAIAEGATTAGMVGAANTGLAAGTATLGGLTAAEAIGQALPYTEAFDAVNLANQGLGAEQIAQNLTVSGLDSFLAEDMARLAAQGLSPEQIATTLSYSYTPAELAGTGIESKALGAASKGLTARQAVQAARLGSSLLGGQQQQPMSRQQMMIGGSQPNQYGGVDYSGLLSLLTPRMVSRNSLLG